MNAAGLVAAALAVAVGVGAAGCGDDSGGSGGAAKPAAKKPAEKKKQAKKGKRAEAISFIPTLEQVVPAEERETIRASLTAEAFLPDPEGGANRDPFRSYVLPQVQVTLTSTPGAPVVSPTERCKQRNLVASEYAVASIKLVGILRRGTRWYALVRGPDGVGHSIEVGDCVGRERAQVVEFSNNLVESVVYPEPVPGAVPPEPTRHRWVLYEDQLTNERDETPDLRAREPDLPAAPATEAPPPGVPIQPSPSGP